MKRTLRTFGIGLLVAACTGVVAAQEEEVNPVLQLGWKTGPATIDVGNNARQVVWDGYLALEADDTRKFLELTENTSSGNEMAVIAKDDFSWFAVYSYDAIGYVRDDEKEDLDARALLEAFKQGNEEGNAERRSHGWSELTLLGWARKPHYDESSHNLEWGLKFRSNEGLVVNYNTRILGRGGVMSVTLVCDPEVLESVLPDFKTALTGFSYKEGHRYAEYRPGDHAAEIGLSALIVGGGVAAGVKTGAFKWIWKALVFVFVAIVGVFKKIFGRGGGDK